MEYQKLANLIDDASNHPSKFRTKSWVEITDKSRGTYMLIAKSNLNYNAGAGDNAAARQGDEIDNDVAFQNCAPFTNCISEINNTQIDNAKDIDIVMPMYNLIEYSQNYAKTSGSLWQYYRDEPNDNLTDSEAFKFKIKITRKTPAAGNEKDVEI